MANCQSCERELLIEGAMFCPFCGASVKQAASRDTVNNGAPSLVAVDESQSAVCVPSAPRHPIGFVSGAGASNIASQQPNSSGGFAFSQLPNMHVDSPVRQLEYSGVVHKCPNCGEVLGSFSSFCPACGFEFRNAKATSSIQELSMRINAIHASESKTPRKKKLFHFGPDTDLSEADEWEISLIKNFSVPNTKEDVLEFIILASSNIDPDALNEMKSGSMFAAEKALSKAWVAKLEQVYQKASLSFGDDPDFAMARSLYVEAMKKVRWARTANLRFWILVIGIWVALFAFVGIMSLVSG